MTPFKGGEIDEPALKNIVERQIMGQVDYLVCLGTTGEASMLSNVEKRKVQDTMLHTNAGRLPFVLGIFSGNHTDAQVQMLSSWDLHGVDALLIASPAYVKPSQEGLFRHYQALAETSPLPIILYNVPGRTASNMYVETVLRIAESFDNVIGIKEASADLVQATKLIKYRPDGFLVISGDDPTALGLLACGGDGVISVIANAFPSEWSQLVHAALANDYVAAAAIHGQLVDLHHWIYVEGNPCGIKAVLELQGICDREVRQPLAKLSDASMAGLQHSLAALSPDQY